MVTLHPNILKKDGKKQFAVLPYEEFLKIQEELNDYEDLKELRQAKDKEKDAPTVSIEDAKKAGDLREDVIESVEIKIVNPDESLIENYKQIFKTENVTKIANTLSDFIQKHYERQKQKIINC